jgi:Zn-dependent M16 (insulinase) family peptidase
MVSSMDQPARRLYRAASTMAYGSEHPLAFVSGGSPEALRAIQPADIRKFHAAHYLLANMGAVVSVPKEMPIDGVLARLDSTLNAVEPRRPNQPWSKRAIPSTGCWTAGMGRWSTKPSIPRA